MSSLREGWLGLDLNGNKNGKE
ncbi:unnamed protein product [Spirodela intermedia]|uniref:Uncharacterized protein n=1 Tax=Spirodela intermedia TaxID=51605 RepID=A0A7I8IMP4_SPIIN|nr:unnamed protein product [Spirodela intermedia]CAA6659040.1 unnamed protein product [Spirodela intermedia]